MKKTMVGCELVLAMMVAATGVQAQSYSIGGQSYNPTGSTETVVANFTPADGGVSAGSYVGLVRLVVSGSGVSCTPATNDAFYIYEWRVGCGNPNVVPQHDPNWYQLTFDSQSLPPLANSRDATRFIVYDINAGAEVLSRPYAPGYRADHTYSFIVDTGLVAAAPLHFGVSDGAFGDNSGAFQIQITQLAVGYQLVVAGGGTGSGAVSSQAGLVPALNCTVTSGVASGACSQLYPGGTSVTLTPAAGTGSTFTGWSGACTGTAPCTVSMTAARAVTATFNLVTYPLTVTASGTGSGTVTSQVGLVPALNCSVTGGIASGACSQPYREGTLVTLTASPAGSTFTGWSGACTGASACVVSVTQARTVTATFVALPEVLSLSPSAPPPFLPGTGVTFTATARYGVAPLQYRFWLYNHGTAAWTVLQEYSTAAQVTWTPQAIGSYSLQVWVRSAGSVANYEAWRGAGPYEVRVPAITISALTTSTPFPVSPGTAVTWTATAAGGLPPLQYQFWLYDYGTSVWTSLQDYSPSSQLTWTPSAAGTYGLQVWVRSTGSTATYEAWRADGPFEVKSTPVTISSVAASTPFPVAPHANVTWTVTASGGSPPLEYQFWLYHYQAASWQVLRAYGPDATATWAPAAAGRYLVQVWVRSTGSGALYEAWQNSEDALVEDLRPTLTAVTPQPPLPVAVSVPVTWTATATGGTAPLQYRFYLYNYGTSTWTLLQDYSAASQTTWTPQAAGTYGLQVWVRSAGSIASWEDWEAVGPFSVTDTLWITSFTANVSPPVTVQTPVTLKATAAGAASIEYRFWLRDPTGAWTVLQDYSASDQVVWTPTTAGDYLMQVWVRHGGSDAPFDAWKGLGPFTVVAQIPTVTALTPNPTSPTAGVPMTWTATATGGVAPLQYQFWLLTRATGTWSMLQGYSPSNQAAWTPPASGDYVLQVWVRGAGSTAAYEAWLGSGLFTVR